MSEQAAGWHFHPRMYPAEAWPDDGCPDPRSAIALPIDDERVLRAKDYPDVSNPAAAPLTTNETREDT